jgi:hypothetical protein
MRRKVTSHEDEVQRIDLIELELKQLRDAVDKSRIVAEKRRNDFRETFEKWRTQLNTKLESAS